MPVSVIITDQKKPMTKVLWSIPGQASCRVSTRCGFRIGRQEVLQPQIYGHEQVAVWISLGLACGSGLRGTNRATCEKEP